MARRLLLACAALLVGAMTTASGALAESKAISFYNIHNRENITIVFKKDGAYVPEALEKLNWFLRDWRQDKPTKIDPKLFDLLADMHRELGSERPIHVISAYRSPKTNAMLRKTRGGQARRSRHMLGMAIDVHFPDVPVHKLRYAALVRQQGGVGYYPRSSIPFVHVDTGRVRHWPRMGRSELALLFPNGRTRHRPADNKPIRRSDAVAARRNNPELAVRVAAFHDLRRNGPTPASRWGSRTQVASAPAPRTPSPPRPRLVAASLSLPSIPRSRPAPRLLTAPKPVAPAPEPFTARADPTDLLRRLAARNNREARERLSQRASADRQKLAALTKEAARASTTPASAASAKSALPPVNWAPKIREDVAWVPTDELDHEHPEELTYAPFPVTPYLTESASPDDPALLVLTHPDATKSLAMLAEAGGQPMAQWTFGSSFGPTANMTRFTGKAVRVAGLLPAPDAAKQRAEDEEKTRPALIASR
jgi:uncharacterized protein YcbK (DUF882 family)